MTNNCFIKYSFTIALATFLAAPAQAVVVSWADWSPEQSSSTSAFGNITVGTESIGVTYTPGGSTWNLYTGAANYWSGTAYTNGEVENAPTPTDVIQLYGGGTITFTFSETVVDPYFALNSWNGNVVNFDTPISIDSYGSGYWGSGTPVNITATGFTGSGELHGIIKLTGSYDMVSITHTSESWHGITVGVAGVANSEAPVPEPTTLLLFATGAAGLAAANRRRK
nr:PEP-CTERM sorting domain-containing protein [uncultured Desulfobulbus sp.]